MAAAARNSVGGLVLPQRSNPGLRREQSNLNTPHIQPPGRVRNQFLPGVVMMKDRGVLPVQPKLAGRGVIQREVADMDDGSIKALSNHHALGKDKEIDQLTEDEIRQMKKGTYLLTELFGAVNCNCFGWALGQDFNTGDKGKIFNWKKAHGEEENFTDPDSESAKIILWGTKDGADEDNWDVTHASVKLTHAELLARSGKFKGLNITKKALSEKGVPDPCWSSAGGFGFGIIVHPRDWYAGGEFGVALKGMKVAR